MYSEIYIGAICDGYHRDSSGNMHNAAAQNGWTIVGGGLIGRCQMPCENDIIIQHQWLPPEPD